MLTPGSSPALAGSARPVATSTNCSGSPPTSRPPAPTSCRGMPSSASVAGPQPLRGELAREVLDARRQPRAALRRSANRRPDVVRVHVCVVPERQDAAAEGEVGNAARAVPGVVVERVEQRTDRAERGAEPRCDPGGRVAADRRGFLFRIAAPGDAPDDVLGEPDDVPRDVAHEEAVTAGRRVPLLRVQGLDQRGKRLVLVECARAPRRCVRARWSSVVPLVGAGVHRPPPRAAGRFPVR